MFQKKNYKRLNYTTFDLNNDKENITSKATKALSMH